VKECIYEHRRNLANNWEGGGQNRRWGLRTEMSVFCVPQNAGVFFLFLHNPNNHFENISIFLVSPSSTQEPKKILRYRKYWGGGVAFAPPCSPQVTPLFINM
jgi:hypothetical protein